MNSDPPALPPFLPERWALPKRLALPQSPLKLLVSVRNAEEVLTALAGGADWIDLKEPNAGPLAAVEACVARKAVQALAGRRTMSAALGELGDWQTSAASEILTIEGIGVVKLGLAGCARLDAWQQRWQAVAEEAAKQKKQLVAVIYADWQRAESPAPDEIIALAKLAGSQYLLIDTYDKSAGTVFDHLSSSALDSILRKAKQVGMTTVLAGSLSLDSIDQVPVEVVDIVAVRGAVCRGDRTSRRIKEFRQALGVCFCGK